MCWPFTKVPVISDELLKLQESLQTHDTTSDQPRKPVSMVPFDRDETFVGRKDIMGEYEQAEMHGQGLGLRETVMGKEHEQPVLC